MPLFLFQNKTKLEKENNGGKEIPVAVPINVKKSSTLANKKFFFSLKT